MQTVLEVVLEFRAGPRREVLPVVHVGPRQVEGVREAGIRKAHATAALRLAHETRVPDVFPEPPPALDRGAPGNGLRRFPVHCSVPLLVRPPVGVVRVAPLGRVADHLLVHTEGADSPLEQGSCWI